VGTTCTHTACRADFTPDDVAGVVGWALGRTPMPRPARARLLRSAFRASGRLRYEVAWSPVTSPADRVREAAAATWESSLPPTTGDDRALEPMRASHREAGHVRVCEALEQLASEASEGARLSRLLARADPVRQQVLSSEVQGRLQAVEASGRLHPETGIIAGYLAAAVASLTDIDVSRVAAAYAAEFSRAARRARHMAARIGTAAD
jgi:hypothetical protein